jgi:DNA replication protein DnaC
MIEKYDRYLDFFAKKCNECKGERRIFLNNVWYSCSCQLIASLKYKFDKIKIYPNDLKNKSWEDFKGINNSGAKLTAKSLIQAKSQALKYCFDTDDLKAIKERKNKSVILNRLKQGTNIVISGDSGSGKSLLAFLILKEIVFYSIYNAKKLTFEWVRSSDLLEAARWDNSKNIDNDLLDYWSDIQFLFIDNMSLKQNQGDHRAPPNMSSINRLFYNRLSNRLPTIILCNDSLLKSDKYEKNKVIEEWGQDFYSILSNENNFFIQLIKSQEKS